MAMENGSEFTFSIEGELNGLLGFRGQEVC